MYQMFAVCITHETDRMCVYCVSPCMFRGVCVTVHMCVCVIRQATVTTPPYHTHPSHQGKQTL